MNDTRSVHSHDVRSDAAFLAAEIVRGSSKLEVCDTWLGGRIYAAVKHWRGIDPELRYLRQAHTLSLTLSGRSDLTGSLVSGAGMYEGRDSPGCVTYVPPGAEKRSWYRNPDLDFLVLVVQPDAVDVPDTLPPPATPSAPLRVLTMGGFGPAKGFALLLRGFAEFCRSRPGAAVLEVVGSMSGQSEFMRDAAMQGIADCVCFRGRLTNAALAQLRTQCHVSLLRR